MLIEFAGEKSEAKTMRGWYTEDRVQLGDGFRSHSSLLIVTAERQAIFMMLPDKMGPTEEHATFTSDVFNLLDEYQRVDIKIIITDR